jgi:hypothetical protein
MVISVLRKEDSRGHVLYNIGKCVCSHFMSALSSQRKTAVRLSRACSEGTRQPLAEIMSPQEFCNLFVFVYLC